MYAVLRIVLRRFLPEFRENEACWRTILTGADFLEVLVERFEAPVGEEIRRCGTEHEVRCLDRCFGNKGLARWRVDQYISVGVCKLAQRCRDGCPEPSFSGRPERVTFHIPCGGLVGEH